MTQESHSGDLQRDFLPVLDVEYEEEVELVRSSDDEKSDPLVMDLAGVVPRFWVSRRITELLVDVFVPLY